MNRKFKVKLTEFLNPEEYPDKVMITHSEYTYGVKLPSNGILNVDSSTDQDNCFDPVNFPNIVLKQVGTTSRHTTDHIEFLTKQDAQKFVDKYLPNTAFKPFTIPYHDSERKRNYLIKLNVSGDINAYCSDYGLVGNILDNLSQVVKSRVDLTPALNPSSYSDNKYSLNSLKDSLSIQIHKILYNPKQFASSEISFAKDIDSESNLTFESNYHILTYTIRGEDNLNKVYLDKLGQNFYNYHAYINYFSGLELGVTGKIYGIDLTTITTETILPIELNIFIYDRNQSFDKNINFSFPRIFLPLFEDINKTVGNASIQGNLPNLLLSVKTDKFNISAVLKEQPIRSHYFLDLKDTKFNSNSFTLKGEIKLTGYPAELCNDFKPYAESADSINDSVVALFYELFKDTDPSELSPKLYTELIFE